MDTFKINQNLNKLYDKNGLMQKYGGEVFITILIIFIVGVLFVYLQVLNNIIPVKQNWAHERCNPFIIPLAGFINNPDNSTMSDSEYTLQNFQYCMGNITQGAYQYILDSFNFILNSILTLFQDLGYILSGIINFIMSVFMAIFGLLKNSFNLALQSTTGLQSSLNKTRDSFSRLVGMVVVTLYVQMLTFRMNVMWMITTPIVMLFSIIVQILIKILIRCLKSQALTMAKWTSFVACVGNQVRINLFVNAAVDDGAISAADAVEGATDEIMADTLFSTGGAELAIPFVGEALAAASDAAGGLEEVASVGQDITSAIEGGYAIASTEAATALSIYQKIGCGLSITWAIFRSIMLIDLIFQVIAFILTITLLILLWNFNKVTLGKMNIPGQGIPGLSF
jgi:hypothetical protein